MHIKLSCWRVQSQRWSYARFGGSDAAVAHDGVHTGRGGHGVRQSFMHASAWLWCGTLQYVAAKSRNKRTAQLATCCFWSPRGTTGTGPTERLLSGTVTSWGHGPLPHVCCVSSHCAATAAGSEASGPLLQPHAVRLSCDAPRQGGHGGGDGARRPRPSRGRRRCVQPVRCRRWVTGGCQPPSQAGKVGK